MKRGLEQLHGQNLPPAMHKEVAVNMLIASMDIDVFGDMADDLMFEAMERLGSIPLKHCARCKAPVFTHEATQIGGRSYCAPCANVEKAIVSKCDLSERHTYDAYEEECTRCNGTGEWRGYLGLDGICYTCGGTGKRPRSRRD